MLHATVVFAFLFSIFAAASRGNAIGFGLVIAILSLFIPFLVFAIIYLVARMFSAASSAPGYEAVEDRSENQSQLVNQPFQPGAPSVEYSHQPAANKEAPSEST